MRSSQGRRGRRRERRNADIGGYAGIVAANSIQVNMWPPLWLPAATFVEQRIEALLVIGNRIEGDIHVAFDQRQALVAGLLGGLSAGLILSMTRVVRRD